MMADSSCSGVIEEQELTSGVRIVLLNLPEDEGEGIGFRLTRTVWDPYPWVREVVPGSRASEAGLKAADCLLQADGVDLLGMPVRQIASLIRGDGDGGEVSLLVWSSGVDPSDDPESLWCTGGGSRGERARRALSSVLRALHCTVCHSTPIRPLACKRSHLYCDSCWQRLDRCALCREPLPDKDSPYARNLVAEEVFQAIAVEYDIKEPMKVQLQPKAPTSTHTSPSRTPNMSPLTLRKHQQISAINRKILRQNYHSDPNIHKSTATKTTRTVENSDAGNWNCRSDSRNCGGNEKKCNCHRFCNNNIPKIVLNDENVCDSANNSVKCESVCMKHRLVNSLRQTCSMVDLQRCALSNSLQNLNLRNVCDGGAHSTSMDDLKTKCKPACNTPLVLLSPPIYLLACKHQDNTT